jgi:hypothetical protein
LFFFVIFFNILFSLIHVSRSQDLKWSPRKFAFCRIIATTGTKDRLVLVWLLFGRLRLFLELVLLLAACAARNALE